MFGDADASVHVTTVRNGNYFGGITRPSTKNMTIMDYCQWWRDRQKEDGGGGEDGTRTYLYLKDWKFTSRYPDFKVRRSEERSDKLITSALEKKIAYARTFVQDAPPSSPTSFTILVPHHDRNPFLHRIACLIAALHPSHLLQVRLAERRRIRVQVRLPRRLGYLHPHAR